MLLTLSESARARVVLSFSAIIFYSNKRGFFIACYEVLLS